VTASDTTHANAKQDVKKSSPEQLEEQALETKIPVANLAKQARIDPRLLTPSGIMQLQRTIGNQAAIELLRRSETGDGAESDSGRISHGTAQVSPNSIQRVHEVAIQGGAITVTGGRPAKSRSRAGAAKKPLAIVTGTMPIGGIVTPVEVHVHMNATDPVAIFSGANVREVGQDHGFAYWSGNTVASAVWLQNILNAGIPDWTKKPTWTAIDTESEIVWQGMPGAGWAFDEAMRVRDRKLKQNYKVKFEVNKNKGNGETKDIITKLCGPRVSVNVASKSTKKFEVTLTYENEQAAYEQLAEDELHIGERWSAAVFTEDPKSDPWA
jgi:hypothetical protein